MSDISQRAKLLDDLFDRIEDWVMEDKFDLVDQELLEVDLAELDPAVIIGYLSTTLCVKDKLKYRRQYWLRVQQYFEKERGVEQTKHLLQGLK